MTTREATSLLPRAADTAVIGDYARSASEWAAVLAFGAIQWPWLLKSLHGGTLEQKETLLDRLELPYDALPHLGSWKADTVLLQHIVAAVEELRPRHAVELGCGASTLVLARALQRNGGGRLTSYDQHADFVAATRAWLREHGLSAEMRHAPLVADRSRWAEAWYDLSHLPAA